MWKSWKAIRRAVCRLRQRNAQVFQAAGLAKLLEAKVSSYRRDTVSDGLGFKDAFNV